ncbi:hypothetical protein JHD50_02500 [Sulfurimonas sp. MAG313]|nr:hypothetical protein [Sulfurimonas sp. MAG313]MDF1880182.1 hypothetical protein [Sulfurimonas sp. MAG313]
MKQSIYLALCASTLLHAQVPALLPIEKRTFSQSQFIPDISLIVDTSFASRNKNQDDLQGLSVPGITDYAFGTGHGYSPNNGFNFNYSELILSANVDPSFSLEATFHFTQESVEIDEAYFTNTTLLQGLRLRGGQFLSDVGRLNNQHPHFWDFNEAPLIYQGFLGAENLSEIGLQAQYTLPLDEYVMLGAEILQGKSENFGYESLTLSNGDKIKGAAAPSMLVAYVKTSFDVGNTTVMPGASYIYGKHYTRNSYDAHEIAFDGSSSVYNLELTIKHYFDSYSFISWQSEWMRLEKKGDEYHVEDASLSSEVYKQKIIQEGIYSQLVYASNTNTRYGLRYESIYTNSYAFTEVDLPSTPYNRYSAMVEYHFSEFSRLRLEYSQNDALYSQSANTFEKQNIHSLIVSLNLSIGAHGAHDF